MQRIVFRADGNSIIGLGHITRCLALAEMLKNDFEIVFTTQTPLVEIPYRIIELTKSDDYLKEAAYLSSKINSNDIVVLDGYFFKTAYQKKIKETNCKLVCIDDLAEWHFVADAIINQANDIDHYKYSIEPYTKIFSGTKYSLLRSPFIEATSQKKTIESIKNTFVSMGGADINNINLNVIVALVNITQIKNIHVVVGSVNPHFDTIKNYIDENKFPNIYLYKNLNATQLCSLMQKCDLSICPASTLAIEACAVNMFLVSGFTANNQIEILKSLELRGALLNLGNLNELSEKNWGSILRQVFLNKEIFKHQLINQRDLVDGQSPKRLKNIFKHL